jgi:hypothetical protein
VDGDVKKRRRCPTHWSRKQERAPLEAREEEKATACPLESLKREIIEVTKTTIKEKANTFSSVGSSSLGKNECGESSGALSAVVFKGFNNLAPTARAEDNGTDERAVEDGDGDNDG